MGFLEALQILFIALKLLGKINWSWWCVCLPIIVELVSAVILALMKHEERDESHPTIRIVKIRYGKETEETEDDDDKGTEED